MHREQQLQHLSARFKFQTDQFTHGVRVFSLVPRSSVVVATSSIGQVHSDNSISAGAKV